MRIRERRDEQFGDLRLAPPGTTGGVDRLGDARRAGEQFLSAADEAIRRVLSRDSEEFLRASRQEGGE